MGQPGLVPKNGRGARVPLWGHCAAAPRVPLRPICAEGRGERARRSCEGGTLCEAPRNSYLPEGVESELELAVLLGDRLGKGRLGGGVGCGKLLVRLGERFGGRNFGGLHSGWAASEGKN